jgi:hypothetical protein
MNHVEHTIEKYNHVNETYDGHKVKKIDEKTADKIVAFLADSINIDGFYRHTMKYPDGRVMVKNTTYSDVQGMVEAMTLNDEKQKV